MKTAKRKTPKVGFVSLGCPKALVDSERILTRLRAEGYEVAASYRAADLVVVNTCGFIDAAVDESLEAIGEALAENGKVIVTGCLGAQPQKILDRHPQVLKNRPAPAYEEVVASVHEHLPPRHGPFVDLIPPQGVKLTPRHYAYLKISEGPPSPLQLLHHPLHARASRPAARSVTCWAKPNSWCAPGSRSSW